MNTRRFSYVCLVTGGLLVGIGGLVAADDSPQSQASPKAEADKPAASPGQAESFSIDPTHSMALFRVRHGVSMFWGRFNKVTGTVRYTPDSESGLELDIAVAIDSVDTGSERLDGHIKSEDFFFADKHPNATFKSKSARKLSDSTYEVSGDFTMRGVTKPLTVKVEWLGTSDSRRGRTCGLETSFTVKRSEYGINYGLTGGMLGDETTLTVAMEGTQRGDPEEGQAGGGLSRFLARFDKNGDGKLQKSEAPERMKERFDLLDTNGDGALDADEAAAMRGRRGGRRGQGLRPNTEL